MAKIGELSKNEFLVLRALLDETKKKQADLSEETGLSLGTINNTLKRLNESGFIEGKRSENRSITPCALEALKPYKVDNAVILAAGLSSRFAPISYEKPKGLLNVRGEILIERQIRQLKEAGIDDISIIVGYKKEMFFFLEEKYGVKIIVNDEYASRGSNASLYVARKVLANSYVCASDNYFLENPFNAYEWKSYYAAEYSDGPTQEWCIETGAQGRIVSVAIGGQDCLYMVGHAYFDREFSSRFKEILKKDYECSQVHDKLWEDLLIEHLEELVMYVQEYESGVLFEFDSLDELREFDPYFLENIDSEVFKNIEEALGCDKSEIHDIRPLKQGITNLSFHFATNSGEYVYRHPGVGTELLVDRNSEMQALVLARDLGVDKTFLKGSPENGWKLSYYVKNATILDASDEGQLKTAMVTARKLHESASAIDHEFDFYDESKRYESLLLERGPIEVPDYEDMATAITRLHEYVVRDGLNICLCHNDLADFNFLVDEDGNISLIDWEYAGMGDYAHDFGTFVVSSKLTEPEARHALELYFGRNPSPEELRHNFAFVAFAGWCWYNWALLKESEGDNVGEWTYIYYKYARDYTDAAFAMYEGDMR